MQEWSFSSCERVVKTIGSYLKLSLISLCLPFSISLCHPCPSFSVSPLFLFIFVFPSLHLFVFSSLISLCLNISLSNYLPISSFSIPLPCSPSSSKAPTSTLANTIPTGLTSIRLSIRDTDNGQQQSLLVLCVWQGSQYEIASVRTGEESW